ncbi:hypothetical protein ETB97_000600 [Aspergillus alliaceus]|uniref:Uncharacterized protein n=1 Tax=Petromyces alliaceus TaxID=209559 RepID=A0A8H6E6C6_PETAA|nr:hypothetical protein ETB97_000600 [Aspergillus burnettii]
MPRVLLDHDAVTLQEGRHIAAQVGDKLIEPDSAEFVTGDVDHITIYRSAGSNIDLRCMADVDFGPDEQVILQQIDPATYCLIGMRSGKEAEFKD